MPTNGFSVKPLKVKLVAGEQKATENCSELSHGQMLQSLPKRQLLAAEQQVAMTRHLERPLRSRQHMSHQEHPAFSYLHGLLVVNHRASKRNGMSAIYPTAFAVFHSVI